MKGFEFSDKPKVVGGLKFIGTGKIKGRLYDVGDYPAAVEADEPDAFITGELYEIIDMEVLAILDEWEEYDPRKPNDSLYIRRLADVFLEDGSTATAWAYFYNKSLEGAEFIKSGNYRQYLQTVKAHETAK